MSVAGDRRPTPQSAQVQGVPASAMERLQVREDIRADEAQVEVERETPEIDDGETTGDLQANLGGAPVTTAAFSELEGDS